MSRSVYRNGVAMCLTWFVNNDPILKKLNMNDVGFWDELAEYFTHE